MYLSHSSESKKQRRRAEGHVGQPLNHAAQSEATVEATREGADVAAKVFVSDGMVADIQSLLDVPQIRVDPVEFRGFHAARAAPGFDASVRAIESLRKPLTGVRRIASRRPSALQVAAATTVNGSLVRSKVV